MATRTDCLPWWHDRFATIPRDKIKSGCRTVNGNVNCRPETLRAAAEAEMRRLGYWKKGPMPLAVYTLARYAASEVGSGPPEEKVAVMEAAINRARGTATARGWYPNGDVNDLLLYRQKNTSHPNYGWYGPIHDASGGAPYGRWAATSKDPGIDDLLIADFVLSGGSKNFARGAITQYGPEHLSDHRSAVPREAQSGNYWVGPLPGVDPWHTFLYMQDKSIEPSSPLGRQLIAAGQAALTRPMQRADWSHLSVCKKPGRPILYAVLGIAAGGLIWWALSATQKLPERYSFPLTGENEEMENI